MKKAETRSGVFGHKRMLHKFRNIMCPLSILFSRQATLSSLVDFFRSSVIQIATEDPVCPVITINTVSTYITIYNIHTFVNHQLFFVKFTCSTKACKGFLLVFY